MGRMLEYLVRGKSQSEDSPPDNRDGHNQQESTSGLDECPYIEVGDPHNSVVGSPSVMSIPHEGQAGLWQPPHVVPVDTTPAPATVAQVVNFERWVAPASEQCPVAPEIITYHHPAHAASQQYCQLFSQLWKEKSAPAILFFGGTDDSKTTTAVMLNLAVSCCFHHHRNVVAVGGDFERPEVQKLLGVGCEIGLRDVLEGNLSLKDVVQKTAVPHLSALPEGQAGAPSADVAEASSWILNWLRKRFELVLIAGPQVTATAVIGHWVSRADGVFLVGASKKEMVESPRFDEWINRSGGVLQGFIHTSMPLAG